MERYSELEGDLSTTAPEGFQQAYAAILAAAARLADHRFMVIITGDVRGEDGGLLNLLSKPARRFVVLCPAGMEHSELPATARIPPSAHQRVL